MLAEYFELPLVAHPLLEMLPHGFVSRTEDHGVKGVLDDLLIALRVIQRHVVEEVTPNAPLLPQIFLDSRNPPHPRHDSKLGRSEIGRNPLFGENLPQLAMDADNTFVHREYPNAS